VRWSAIGDELSQEDLDMKFPAFLTAALIVTAGAAQAQTPSYPSNNMPMEPQQAQSSINMGSCGHSTTITDEYGFRYDAQGNRVNGHGCVIAPPMTPPGGRAIQNGH
jgi:hypothetical protein